MNKQTRDKYRPSDYWEEIISFRLNSDRKRDFLKMYRSAMPDSENGEALSLLLQFYTDHYINELVCACYSRGDDLQSIRAGVIDESVSRYLTVVREIAHYSQNMELTYDLIQQDLKGPHRVQSVYTLLCWLICFDVEEETMKTLAPYITVEGEDRIIDSVLSRYQPGRKIADACAFPRLHRLLDSMFDSDAKKRVSLATQYLDRWGKLMSLLKGLKTVGGAAVAKGAKSNADLAKLREKDIYKGFWAWDLALMVRVLEIDDSSFADHELYPADLANFRA